MKSKRLSGTAVCMAAVLSCSMPFSSMAFGWFGPGANVTAAQEQNAQKDSGAQDAQQNTAAQDAEYQFRYGETMIGMGAEAKPALDGLGAPVKPVFEQDSCAYQGKDRVYTYNGFEISTFQNNGKECILSVYILEKSVLTPEGIGIGSTAQDVLKAYGEAKDELGVYRYTKGKTILTVFTTNGVVDAIEYLYAV